MRALNGMTLSFVLGLIGAGLWIALARVYDVGLLVLLACVVGGLVGYGMALGSKARGGAGLGFVAACICLACCLTAKGAIAYFRASDFVSRESIVTDEDAYDALCHETYVALVDEGELSGAEETYPNSVYDSATEQWQAMTDAEREEYKAAIAAEWQGYEGAATGVASILAFFLSWGLLDLFCVCSAIGTAFKIGSHRGQEEIEEIPAWALGATPGANAEASGPAAAGVATPAAPVAGGAPVFPSPVLQMAAEPAADSYWTRLGSEPPARETPSMRRAAKSEPAAGSAEAGEGSRAKAA